MATTYTLHFMHQSLQVGDRNVDTYREIQHSLEDIRPDLISWTEANGVKNEIRELCRNLGYQPVFFPESPGEAFAFNALSVKLKSAEARKVTDGDNARYICWISVMHDDQRVFYHTGHWYDVDAQSSDEAIARHNKMTQQMAQFVRRHGNEGAVSFFSGDLEVAQRSGLVDYTEITRQNDLVTCWDEAAVYPPTLDTGDATVDVIGSYKKDRKVSLKRYKRHPVMSSDHRALSCYYDIERLRNSNQPPTDFTTGGNIDWSDYLRGDQYNLPQAVDDSGDPRHGGLISD